MKAILKKLIPVPAYFRLRRHVIEIRDGSRSNRSIFAEIYRSSQWGSGDLPFHSGFGSRGRIVEDYIEALAQFIQEKKIRHLVDLGCGDFEVAKLLLERLPELKYTGADVVPELVDYLKANYQSDRVSFVVCDASSDPLPEGDACLLRQVLQHLNNTQVKRILDRVVSTYPRSLVTESHPVSVSIPNLDKHRGSGLRHDGKEGSGIFPELPPFSLKAERIFEHRLKLEAKKYEEILVTYDLSPVGEGQATSVQC